VTARAAGSAARRAPELDANRLREQFPILAREVHGRPLVYLDNAATTQKPRAVIDAVSRYYERTNSNVHRGVHRLAAEATEAYEGARETVRAFLGAASTTEVVFTRGTTEGINLVAQSFVRPRLAAGDEVLISAMEHHANIVPWQLVTQATGARLVVVPIGDDGAFALEDLVGRIGPRTRLVAVGHVSNALGTVNPVEEIVAAAHARGVPVLVDAAQSVPHLPLDVRRLGADFTVFSGHKVYGPTGIGVLHASREHLEAMPPWQGGGDMIRSVTFEKTEWNDLPWKFEAGTPNISGAIGLGAALAWVEGVGRERIARWEHALLEHATTALAAVPGLRFVGTAPRRAALVSFVMEGIHPHDLGTFLDGQGIAVRTGHHCAQPVMDRFGVPATTRASFAVYNTPEEVDALAAGLRSAREFFGA
jgi:cysteine desulfurase/selenocysteine lyase